MNTAGKVPTTAKRNIYRYLPCVFAIKHVDKSFQQTRELPHTQNIGHELMRSLIGVIGIVGILLPNPDKLR